MYAVIATGGKQYKVEKDDVFEVERIPECDGDSVVFEHVLLSAEGDAVTIGTPFIANAKVTCEILGEKKAQKIIVFKYKRRKDYRRTQGHRQKLLRLKVTDICV